jgi:biopolymer transport protein ExbD
MAAKLGGGGGGKFDLGQNADMNVTPFVDVMLVLLIIFMVVAPLATVSIKIDLPPATPPPKDKSKPPTFISIADSGQIFVSFGAGSMKPSSMAGLASDLPASLGVPNPTNERIFIRADRHVKYSQFMDVINQLQLDGYYKIGLIAEDLGGG